MSVSAYAELSMFKVMTRALSIPHFGYTHSVDLTTLGHLRKRVNDSRLAATLLGELPAKLTALPTILEAFSMAFAQHPLFDFHLDTTDPQKPQLILKESHDFGVAIDTPNGLLVPVLKDVQNRSVFSIASEISRLSGLAQKDKLAVSDSRGVSFNISNIGSIGGNVVSPVIVPPMVAIVGVGIIEGVVRPAPTSQGGAPSICHRKEAILSWSCDHPILDGASVARCAELVASILENIEHSGLFLK